MSAPPPRPEDSVPPAAKETQPLNVPGEDYPKVGAVLDLIPASRGDAYMSWVEDVAGEDLVVSIPKDLARRPVALAVGEQIEVIWKASGALRCLPAVLAEIDLGEPPHWRLRSAGVVKRGQRREAVRAPLRVPVVLGTGASAARAMTLDLSEGGLGCVLDREPRPLLGPSAPVSAHTSFGVGDVVRVSVTLPELTVNCLAEITRRLVHDAARTDLSLRFIGLPEHVEDALRRHVFARLRDLRQRGLL